jgi:hypothetical protein
VIELTSVEHGRLLIAVDRIDYVYAVEAVGGDPAGTVVSVGHVHHLVAESGDQVKSRMADAWRRRVTEDEHARVNVRNKFAATRPVR